MGVKPLHVNNDTQYLKLLNAGYRYVSFRPRSEKEITDFLQKKLHTWHTTAPAVLTKVLDRFRELGYMDDRKFITWWVEQRNTHRPKGKRVIVQELQQKGINKSLIEEVLSETRDGSDETDLAKQALSKKLDLWKNLSKLDKKKKIYDYLTRRGFSFDSIRGVIDEALTIE